jgi:hypothetical protein
MGMITIRTTVSEFGRLKTLKKQIPQKHYKWKEDTARFREY